MKPLLTEADFPSATNIITEGEKGDAMYIIIEGGATVIKCIDGQNKQVDTMTTGAYFGQDSLLTEQVRNATIKAAVVTGCKCLVMQKEIFDKHVSQLISVHRK